jgi:aerobic-type carbon monoxide dehydrogenase small subunit (CoxS/CutS family)
MTFMRQEKQVLTLTVNGRALELVKGPGPTEVDPAHTLAHTLRHTLGLTGTKVGCDQGSCGACTVLLDGLPVLSCQTLTVECDGKSVTTIEGLHHPRGQGPHPLQEAFVEHSAFQCGFCTPGILMSAKALLDARSEPTRAEVAEALAGHHCRCISHYPATEAVLDAGHRLKDQT